MRALGPAGFRVYLDGCEVHEESCLGVRASVQGSTSGIWGIYKQGSGQDLTELSELKSVEDGGAAVRS